MIDELPAQRAAPRAAGFGLIDVALVAAAVIWGGNFAVVKTAVREIEPMAFSALRFGVATVALVVGLLVLVGRGERIRLSRHETLLLVLLAVASNVGYQSFFSLGISRTTSGTSALIVATTPALVALISHGLRLEHLDRRAWSGVALSLGGLAMVIVGGSQAVSFTSATLVGNALTLGAALSWAIGTVMTRVLVERQSPYVVTTLSNVVAAPVLVLLALPGLRAQDWAAVSAGAWLSLLASGLLAISLAYVLWSMGVQRLGGSRTALYANLIPVVALVIGGLFLAERLTLLQLAGAAGVVGGIALARLGE
jgi:drug/metabolite transporter (DMT)-like permease